MLHRLTGALWGGLLIVLVSLAAGPAMVRAADMPNDPSAFIEELSRIATDDILGADISQDQQIARFKDLIDTAFDMPFIARFVVSGHWNSATEAEREEFQRLFTDLNVINWGTRFDDYNGQEITVTGVTGRETRGGTLHEVSTAIGAVDGSPMQVIWVLRTMENGELGVIDLKVEGVSLAQTFRSEYRAVLKNTGSMSGLNAVIEEKITSLRARQAQ